MKKYIIVSGAGTCTYYVLGYEFNKSSFIFLINNFLYFNFFNIRRKFSKRHDCFAKEASIKSCLYLHVLASYYDKVLVFDQ